jgi:hypothetical protein
MARPGLTGHRKFKRLTRVLGSPIVARGVLELLWDHCYESGDDYVGTAEDIEAIVGWTGEAGLTRALADVGAPNAGFIESVDDGSPARYRVHDLWHHAPDYVRKRRERESARLKKLDPSLSDRRQSDRRTAPNGSQCSAIADWQDGDGRTPSPSPSPSPGEKSVSPEPAEDGDSVPDEAVMIFSTVGQDGPEWSLTRSQLDTWGQLYPTIDVEAEMRKALAYIGANPGRRKTGRGMPRFCVNWLNRATDTRSGGGSAGGDRPFTTRELEAAGNWRRAVGRCPHSPTCGTGADCSSRYIRERLRLQAAS